MAQDASGKLALYLLALLVHGYVLLTCDFTDASLPNHSTANIIRGSLTTHHKQNEQSVGSGVNSTTADGIKVASNAYECQSVIVS